MTATLSTGELWRPMAVAAAPTWEALALERCPVTAARLAVGCEGLVVTAQAAPGGVGRVGAAWMLTGVLGALVALDDAFAGVPATVVVGALTVAVPGGVLAGVVAGRGRSWWAARVAMTVGAG